MSAIGINNQSAELADISTEWGDINSALQTIATELSSIQAAIQTQTCVDALNSSAVTGALSSIATVNAAYSILLQAVQEGGPRHQRVLDTCVDFPTYPSNGSGIGIAGEIRAVGDGGDECPCSAHRLTRPRVTSAIV